MEDWKIEHFKRDHQTVSFPWYRSLSTSESLNIRRTLAHRLGTLYSGDDLALVKRVDDLGRIVQGVNAEDPGFSMARVLTSLGITPPQQIIINWFRYDKLDEMFSEDLDRYFEYIWYPAAEDIDILDGSVSWILSISHYCQLKFLKFV